MKKSLTVWIAIGVILGLVIVYFSLKSIGPNKPNNQKQTKILNGQKTTVAAPGASAVSEKGIVLTEDGNVAKNDAEPGTPEAPKESMPLSNVEIPKSSIVIEISKSGIAPTSFTVKPGEAVTLTAKVGDGGAHVFKFRDPSLQAVALGISPDETRAITFNAPKKIGEYEFYCDIPGHPEVGKMIVE